MNLDQKEFKKIIEFLSLENFYIDKDFIPKPIGDGQSNPTFLIRDERKKFKVLRTQPIGNLARGAHRVDREFSVLKALYNKGFECPEPFSLCNNPELIGRMFYVMGFEEGDINFNPFLPNENFEDKQKIYKSLAEVLGRLHSYDIGVSTSVGIGGDPINGSSFRDVLARFEEDPDTDVILMIGEIGGPQEVDAGNFAKENMKKPVVAYIAGLTAPKGRVMGHAGAIVSAYGESAVEKVELLKECGVTISKNPSVIGETIKSVLNK